MAKRGLAPILPRRLRVLILGSFPSEASLAAGQYYAHAQNKFWPVLEACGIVVGARDPYATRVAAMRARHVGLWDLYARVEREGSGGGAIRNAVPNDIAGLWAERGPFAVLLNGASQRPREWRRYFSDLTVEPVALPSTSPRPQHWNAPESTAAAIAKRRAAFRAAGVRPATSRRRRKRTS